MENNKFLGSEKISKLLLKFSIPCIFSLLISSLYNIVDQIFIGNSVVGYLGNAATTIVFPLTIISLAFAWCFGNGVSAYMSLSQGRNDTQNTHKAIGNSILLSFIIGIIFVIISFLFMDDLLYLFGASDKSIGLAKDYFTILLFVMPLYMVSNTINPVIRADGSPKYSMCTTLTGAITNIILDPIFIFGFNMGIKGAAIATIIAQLITFILEVTYLRRSKTFKISKESFHFDKHIFSNVLKLGISTMITQLSIVIIALVSNKMLFKYGSISKYGADIPIAVIGICMKVFTIVINIVVGIILGAQPILGYNFGAKKYDRVLKTYKCVLIPTIIVGIIATLIFQLCPELIIRIFGNENDLYMDFAVSTFKIFLMFVSFTCIIKITSIFFQAVGSPLKAVIISLSRDILLFVPLVIILPKYYGIMGCLWAAPIADLIALIITLVLLFIFYRDLKKIKVTSMKEASIKPSKEGVIITIARTHGSCGKEIGKLVSEKLNIPYYYKEMISVAAKESGLSDEFISKINTENNYLHSLYLSTSPIKYAIEAQDKIIKKLADNGSCLIVGRAADYVLRNNPHVIKIFIYADDEYRIKQIMKNYGDSKKEAKKNIEKSDKARASYYNIISGASWGDPKNYDLLINSNIGVEKTAEVIVNYIKNL